MSFDKLSKIASSVSQYINDNEKISVAFAAARCRKALQDFPGDQTITLMASTLGRMSEKSGFISRADFRKMYQGYYVRNTRFGEVFASELGDSQVLKGPKYANRSGEGDGTLQNDYEKLADPVLANALATAFGNQEIKNFSEKDAQTSVKKVSSLLNFFGLQGSVKVASGNPDCIVVEATFETPKGHVTVVVPVEIQDKLVLEPSVFVSNQGPFEFTKSNLTDYIKASAGSKLNVTAAQVLEVVKNIKNSGKKEISSVELALTRLNAAAQPKSEFFVNSITAQSVDQPVLDVALPKVSDSKIESFAKKFDSPVGMANFIHGNTKLASASKMIESKLREAGIKKAQLGISDCSQDSVSFAVNVGSTSFSIPVKMASAPTADVFLCNGKVREFSAKNIQSLMSSQEFDYKAAAVASPLYDTKPSDLVQTVRVAMEEENFPKAEDALNVLASLGDSKAYAVAMNVYLRGLNKSAAPESPKQCCNHVIKTANSVSPICGHTGLPLSKVYQDQYGDCRPLYRKAMSDTYEGAAFMSNKIFF